MTRAANSRDFDAHEVTAWREAAMLKDTPVMLVRGETSLFMTDAIIDRLRPLTGGLEVVMADGQGHVPLLEKGALPAAIRAFLRG